MSYQHIDNLYKNSDIFLFKECYALEKIHGTSAHIGWQAGNLSFFSGGAAQTNFEKLFDKSLLAEKLTEKFGAIQNIKIYGEAYGGKMQGMSKHYGAALKFVGFEVQINDNWLAVPNAHDVCTGLGLEFVYYVKIPTTVEAINAERDADSVQAIRNGMGTGKIREGVVLRPLIELKKNNGERIIVKHKRDEFRETSETRSIEVDPGRLKVLQDAEAIANEWVTVMRLKHVLDKLEVSETNPMTMKRTQEVITAMLEDVVREGQGEFVNSPEAIRAISRQAAKLFKLELQPVGV